MFLDNICLIMAYQRSIKMVFLGNACLIMAFPELSPMSIPAKSKRAEKMLELTDEGS